MTTTNQADRSETCVAVDGTPTDDVIRVEADLYAVGRDTALDSGRFEPEPATERHLEALADDAAARLAAAPYDPEGNAADRLVELRHHVDLKEAERCAHALAHARAVARDARLARADQGAPPASSIAATLVALLAALFVGLLAAFTLHDVLFAALFKVRAQAFVAALLSGAAFGGLLSAYAFAAARRLQAGAASDAVVKNVVLGVIELVLGGAGFFALRSSLAAADSRQMSLAAGLALLEALCFVLVRVAAWRAEALAAARTEAFNAIERADAVLEAALDDVERWERESAAVAARIDAHVQLVRAREHRVRAAVLIRASARSAILAGYRAGLEENLGHVAGVMPVRRPRLGADLRAIGSARDRKPADAI